MYIKKFTYKIAMSLLLAGAIYTTLSSITNVTIVDLKNSFATETTYSGMNTSSITAFMERETAWAGVEEPAKEQVNSYNNRQTYLPEKKLNQQLEKKEYISSEQIEGPKTLEEAININQYPSKKVVATGYTAGVESTGKSPGHPQYGITYSGVKVKRDLYSTIAADLNIFPLGTILYIPNYGYGVVTDIGGAIKGNTIDLYFETVQDVYQQWGKQEVQVFVIKEGNGKITEQELVALNENEALQVFRQQIIGTSKE